MSDIAIVVVAFNRENALKRCLHALSKAQYTNKIELIISIDRSDSNATILELANHFLWKYGQKKVIYQNQHLGLREHILKCGDLSQEYGNIILLEDDIYVSPYFYNFSTQAVEFYQVDHRIAGISLYSPRYNETAGLPFVPLQSNYDIFFSQFPSSWGQLWTPDQWKMFRDWYNTSSNLEIDLLDSSIPQNVKEWPESSWKKYFFKYMITHNKYFVYPYISLSTNFGDIGTHFKNQTNRFQVPLSYHNKERYCFCKLGASNIVYDAFCESLGLYELFSDPIESNLSIDLYATKSTESYKRFVLSTKELDFRILNTYPLSLKPMEDNIIQDIQGCSIYLYDTSVKCKFPVFENRISLKDYFYQEYMY